MRLGDYQSSNVAVRSLTSVIKVAKKKSGVRSKSQNNANGASCVNSATREIIEAEGNQKSPEKLSKTAGSVIPPFGTISSQVSLAKSQRAASAEVMKAFTISG